MNDNNSSQLFTDNNSMLDAKYIQLLNETINLNQQLFVCQSKCQSLQNSFNSIRIITRRLLMALVKFSEDIMKVWQVCNEFSLDDSEVESNLVTSGAPVHNAVMEPDPDQTLVKPASVSDSRRKSLSASVMKLSTLHEDKILRRKSRRIASRSEDLQSRIGARRSTGDLNVSSLIHPDMDLDKEIKARRTPRKSKPVQYYGFN